MDQIKRDDAITNQAASVLLLILILLVLASAVAVILHKRK